MPSESQGFICQHLLKSVIKVCMRVHILNKVLNRPSLKSTTPELTYHLEELPVGCILGWTLKACHLPCLQTSAPQRPKGN